MITAAISHGLTISSRPDLLDYLDEFIVSLDSPKPETNDRLRGEGSYRGAVEAIDIAHKRGVRTFVNMVLTRDNFSDVEAMLEFCEARGLFMNAQPVMFDRQVYDNAAKALALTSEQIRTVHQQMAKWKRQDRNIVFSARAYEQVADWADFAHLSTRSAGESSCMAGRFYIHIEPNGDILPCVQYDADFTPKNIIKDGLDAALRNVQRHNCGDCWTVYLNERKAMFGLKPSALGEFFWRDRGGYFGRQ